MSRFSLRTAQKIIALDRFMRERIVSKGIEEGKILVLPPFAHDSHIMFDGEGRNRFRKEHGLEGKFVVMYSGNHSPCHPLDTVLAAAIQLQDNKDIVFCFVGGGSEFRRIKQSENGTTIRCFPYQPLNTLRASLSAADVHLVVMGEPFVGLVHPCKIYNCLAVRAPLICVAPASCHISDLLKSLGPDYPAKLVRHGDVQGLICSLLALRRRAEACRREVPQEVLEGFSMEAIVPQIVGLAKKPEDSLRPSGKGHADYA